MEDLGKLPVRGPGGRVFRLGELADIRQEEEPAGRFNRINGQPAVSMAMSRLPGADAIKTAARIREALAELQPTLPPGVRFRLHGTRARSSRSSSAISPAGRIAFLAVMLVLAVLLRASRGVSLVMGSAAVSIAGTALCLYLLDIPANLLTLAGLGMGIGILVQNGLIVVERLGTVPDTPEARAQAGRRILPAVVGSTLTTAVVLFPFLYLQGNARAAFVPFAAAFAIALAWSVVASVVMIPALGAGHGMRTGHWPRMQRFYDRVLIRMIRWRYATIALSVIVLGVLGWGFATRVERVSFSGFGGERTTIRSGISFPRGSDPEGLDRAMREFESIVVGREGVEQVRAQGYGGGFARMEVLFSKDAAYTAIPR